MPYSIEQGLFDESRLVVLQVAVNDLLAEHNELRTRLNIEKFKDEAYEDLHANVSRHWLIDLLNYSEDEIMTACDKAIQQLVVGSIGP